MNQQQIFDRVATHLLTQNAVSIDKATRLCCYRSPDGLMCAVGCLIPDELYSLDLEGAGVHAPTVRDVLAATDVLIDDPDMRSMLNQLQELHDDAYDTSVNPAIEDTRSWPDGLRGIARRFGLDASVVDRVLSMKEG